jgi:hypothetical protein
MAAELVAGTSQLRLISLDAQRFEQLRTGVTRVLENWKLMSMNQVFSSGFFLDKIVC